MALLQDIKDRVILRSDAATWQTMVTDMSEELSISALDSSVTYFGQALSDAKDVYGLSQADVDFILLGNVTLDIPPTITTAVIYAETFAGGSTDGLDNGIWARGCTIERDEEGQWVVDFLTAHTEGINYHVSLTTEEEDDLRDTPYITVVEGSKTSLGFELQILEGDNGAVEDSYVDAPWSFSVSDKITVLTP